MSKLHTLMGKINRSLIFVTVGIILFYAVAIAITLIAPRHLDSTWTEPTSYYQVQMYEVADPRFFISSEATGAKVLQYVFALEEGVTLQAYQESDTFKIVAPKELEKFITKKGERLKLTSRALLLRPKGEMYELYDPGRKQLFSIYNSDGITQDFVSGEFELMEEPALPWHKDPGVIFVKNPMAYRIRPFGIGANRGFKYDPEGTEVTSLEELTGEKLGFRSRKELIAIGEKIYAHEGCFYCHTDQTRTLVQDVVLNGTESFPAPPSSSKEYIYQSVTFPGTKRNGPDLSRTGVKRPSRDWHKAHFWSPKTASSGSIMPSFQHFFDFDPRGTGKTMSQIPNERFEAIYQYLMTKGTRIFPPTEAWWEGKDPIQTLQIIGGKPK